MSINTSDFNQILRNYDKKQARNHQLHIARQEEVYHAIPRIAEIQKEIAAHSMKAIQSTLRSPEQKEYYDTHLKEILKGLKAEKQELLLRYNYPSNYLDPIYDCTKCKDTGYVQNQRCHCLTQAIIEHSYKQSNIAGILSRENFSTFSFRYYSDEKDPKTGISPLENIRSVHSVCVRFVEEFDQTFENLILYGQSGLGKTFLCNCIAKELLDGGKTVIYLSAFQLFRLFENYRFHKDEDLVTYEDIDHIFTCDLLIIDDLGTEFNNSLTKSELFNCLNSRLLNRKSTVISTNLGSHEWVKEYSERIISRIFGYYTQLKFFGKDIRLSRYS